MHKSYARSLEGAYFYNAILANTRLRREQLGSVIAHGLDFLDPSLVILGTDAPEIVPHVEEKLVAVARARSVCGRVEELAPDLVTHRLKLEIHTLTPDTIARGAIVPRLQEMALAPLPMNGVFG